MTARRNLLPVLGIVLLFVCTFGAGAAAARPAGRIISPAANTLVTGRRLVVRARVGAGATHLEMRVAGRRMRLERVPGAAGVVRASASVRGLPRGRVAVTMSVREHGARVSRYRPVVLGRRAPGLLRGVELPRRAVGAVRMKVRLDGRISVFRVSVDGRRARLLSRPGSGTTIIPLSADDGLRAGRNRVVVSAYRARTGRWDRATRTVWIAPAVPLSAAGRDRRVAAGSTVRLDGSGSLPARPRERLAYRWQIVSQPGRPHRQPPARLIDPRSVRPRLITHRPGTYKVALRLAGVGRRRPVGAATASEVEPPPLGDVMTVEAGASAPPYGLHISTGSAAGGQSWRTTIEGIPIGPGGGDTFEAPSNDLQVITLNRATLAVESVSTQPDPSLLECSLTLAAEVHESELRILTAAPGICAPPGRPAAETTFGRGFTVVRTADHDIVTNFGHELGDGPGGLGGLLRRGAGPGGGSLYTFVFPEAVEFDTYVEAPRGGPFTEVAGKLTPVELQGGSQGIAVMVLNPAFEPVPSLGHTYSLTGGAEDTGTLLQLTLRLAEIQAKDPGGVVLLQTIGDPAAHTPTWGAVGTMLEKLGGTPSVWDALDGNGNYALVAAIYPESETAAQRQASTLEASGPLEGGEASQSIERWVGTARGILGRGENGVPIVRGGTSLPTETTPAGEPISAEGLTVLAEAEPRPWPLSDPAHEAALAWISQRLGPELEGKPIGLGNPAAPEDGSWCFSPTNWDVRAEYCNEVIVNEWNTTYTRQLEKLTYREGEAEFTVAEFEEVAKQLESEFTDIATVHELIRLLKEPFVLSQGAVATDFVVAGEKVEREISEFKEPVGLSPGTMADSITTSLQDLDWGEDLPGAPVVLGLVEGAINIGLELADSDDGEPASSPFFVTDKAQVGAEAAARIGDAVAGIGALEDLLVSDWTKLSTTARNVTTIWGLGNNSILSQAAAIQHGTEAWLYAQMLPGAYGETMITPEHGATVAHLHEAFCIEIEGEGEYTQEVLYEAFKKVTESGVFGPLIGVGPANEPLASSLAVVGTTDQKYMQVPSTELMDHLFAPSRAGGVGLYRAPFFTWAWAAQKKTLETVIEQERGLGKPALCKGVEY